MKKIYTHFKNLTLNFGIGNSKATKLYNTIGLNKKFYPLKLKISQAKSLTTFMKSIRVSKNLKNFIREHIEFDQKIKTFKSIKTRSNFFLKNKLTTTNVKKKNF